MKRKVIFGTVALLLSFSCDYVLAYNFMSFVNIELSPETMSLKHFAYIFACFISTCLTFMSVAYILGEEIKTLLKYLGGIISAGIGLGVPMGLLLAAVDHNYYLVGSVVFMTTIALLLCLMMGIMFYKRFTDED